MEDADKIVKTTEQRHQKMQSQLPWGRHKNLTIL